MDPTTRKNIQLLQAVDEQDHGRIEDLLFKDSANPNFMIPNTDNGNGTLLHIAVANGDPESVRILLKSGAKFDTRCEGKATPWELAKKNSDKEVLAQFESYVKETNENQELQEVMLSKNFSYKRRPGTSSISGQLFESKLMALILLRLKELKCPFYLGSNMDGVGHFDDIVIRYRLEKDKKDKLVFIQAKHSDNPGKKIKLEAIRGTYHEKGIFSVHKNFQNYLMIRETFRRNFDEGIFSGNFDEGIFSGNFEDLNVELILYTTSMVDLPEKINYSVMNPLLKTNDQGKVLQIMPDEMIVEDICKYANIQLKEKECYDLARDFLKKFKIYYHQAKEEEVGNIIMKNMNGNNPQLLYLLYHDLVQAYWRKTDQTEFLTENCDILDCARKKMNDQPMIANFTEICYNTAQRYQLKYTEDSFNSLEIELSKRVVNVYSTTPGLSFAKISYYLRQKLEKSLAIVDINQSGKDCTEILSMFMECPTFKHLVILCTKDEDCEKVKDYLLNLLERNKSIIIISNENSCETLSDVPDLHKICDSQISLADVTKESQDIIFKTKSVTFQGRNIRLIDLLGETHENDHIPRKFISGPILLSLLGDSFEIACLSNKQIKYYINRKFRRFDQVDELNNTNTLFIIEEPTEVENNKDLVVIKDSKETFNQVCKENPLRNVHWFVECSKQESKYYVWKSSSNDLDNMRGILKYNDEELHESFADRVVIIAAEPGMGKSTMLTELMNDKKENSIAWTVRINLKDYTNQFKQMEVMTVDLGVAKNFLFKTLDSRAPEVQNKIKDVKKLEKKVFERCYGKGEVIILVDGFDEIVPYFEHSVLDLLKAFESSNIRQLIVTTRDNNAKIILENRLKVFSHSMMPFSDSNINEFLEKYWKLHKKNKKWNHARFTEFATELIKQYSRSASNKFVHDNSFISNPLHIEMVAECTQTAFEDFHNTGGKEHLNKLKNELNLSSLYTNFVDIKFKRIYCKDKNALNTGSLFFLDNKVLVPMRKQHMRLALNAMFTKEIVKTLLPQEEFLKIQEDFDEVNIGKEKKGFVNRIVDGKPQFTHQTFAEYFAAEAIWEAIKQSSMNKFKSIVEQVLFDDLIVNGNEQICRFVRTLALGDTNLSDIENISNKGLLLMKSFNLHALRYKEKSYALLLGIIERFIRHESPELVKSIELLSDKNKSLLLKASAMMGYLDLVNVLTKQITITFLANDLENGLWNESPLLIAAENHCDKVVNIFVRDFQYDVAWLDVRQKSLFSFLLQEKNYACIQYLLNLISDLGKMYGDGQLPLYEALRAKGTPQELIETLLQVTDVDFFNKNALPNVDWYLLGYDLSLTEKMLNNDFKMQLSKIGIRKGQESQTWEMYCDDYNRHSTKQEKRTALDIFSQQFEVWIDRMEYLCKNGVGFHQESLEEVKKIYYVLKFVIIEQEYNTNSEQMLLKAIIINPTCSTVQLEVKKHSDESHYIHLWLNDSEKIDLSNKIEESVKTSVISAHENGLLQNANKTQILDWLDINEIPDFEENTHNLISEIVKYEAIGMLSDALQTLEYTIQKEELQKRFDKLSKLVQLMEQIIQDWYKLKNAVEINSNFNTTDYNFAKTVINCVNKKYGSLLHYATFKNNLTFAKNLLENGALPNITVKSFNPERLNFNDDTTRVFEQEMTTPMHLAAARGYLDIIEALNQNGANINFKTSSKLYTPLHVAACEGHAEVVQYLKENGAIDSFENADTPLNLAKKYNHKKVIKILIS